LLSASKEVRTIIFAEIYGVAIITQCVAATAGAPLTAANELSCPMPTSSNWKLRRGHRHKERAQLSPFLSDRFFASLESQEFTSDRAPSAPQARYCSNGHLISGQLFGAF